MSENWTTITTIKHSNEITHLGGTFIGNTVLILLPSLLPLRFLFSPPPPIQPKTSRITKLCMENKDFMPLYLKYSKYMDKKFELGRCEMRRKDGRGRNVEWYPGITSNIIVYQMERLSQLITSSSRNKNQKYDHSNFKYYIQNHRTKGRPKLFPWISSFLF